MNELRRAMNASQLEREQAFLQAMGACQFTQQEISEGNWTSEGLQMANLIKHRINKMRFHDALHYSKPTDYKKNFRRGLIGFGVVGFISGSVVFTVASFLIWLFS